MPILRPGVLMPPTGDDTIDVVGIYVVVVGVSPSASALYISADLGFQYAAAPGDTINLYTGATYQKIGSAIVAAAPVQISNPGVPANTKNYVLTDGSNIGPPYWQVCFSLELHQTGRATSTTLLSLSCLRRRSHWPHFRPPLQTRSAMRHLCV